MKDITKKAAAAPGEETTATKKADMVVMHYKDKYFTQITTSSGKKVYNLLRQGGTYSVADISQATKLCDPRGAIRHLRNAGIPIGDIWCSTPHNGRYKRYFLSSEQSLFPDIFLPRQTGE
ncbi:MAG: hypothetical protein K2F53_04420 [Rikenellaceae bacterium]|nr:hypothetical protein [Rikenellaceae bacterium]MDE7134374.1 hypothetical protein [Rikenellaceae bacterium]MDE7355511.1 hypothetical protein [Rikenellaceae bacterium]